MTSWIQKPVLWALFLGLLFAGKSSVAEDEFPFQVDSAALVTRLNERLSQAEDEERSRIWRELEPNIDTLTIRALGFSSPNLHESFIGEFIGVYLRADSKSGLLRLNRRMQSHALNLTRLDTGFVAYLESLSQDRFRGFLQGTSAFTEYDFSIVLLRIARKPTNPVPMRLLAARALLDSAEFSDRYPNLRAKLESIVSRLDRTQTLSRSSEDCAYLLQAIDAGFNRFK